MQEQDTGVELYQDALNNNNSSYHFLNQLNGENVLSKQFENKEMQLLQQEKQQANQLVTIVLEGDQDNSSNTELLHMILYTNKHQLITGTKREQWNTFSAGPYIAGISLIILFGIYGYFYKKRRKKRKEGSNDYDHDFDERI